MARLGGRDPRETYRDEQKTTTDRSFGDRAADLFDMRDRYQQDNSITYQQHGMWKPKKQQGTNSAAAAAATRKDGIMGRGSAGGGGGYAQDPYQAQANALYQQLMERGDFRYDLQGDMLYRQYADQYSQLGQQAMRDAMGTAAGLTGGYGNSYANMVGNQAYQQYLGQLNAMVPEFYDRAYQRWQDEGNELLNKYDLALSRVSAGGGQSAPGGAGMTADTTESPFAQFVATQDPQHWQDSLVAAQSMNIQDVMDLLALMQAQAGK